MVVVELNANSAKVFTFSVTRGKIACLVYVSVVGQVFSPQM